ncbi:RepB family protein [Psychromonas sp.]|uniref:RepB family protein n=1 Tax=Psychromonas sp. TaxID=1884585 RepID=UPI00356425BC
MPNSLNTFNKYYDVQESWIRRQIDNLKDDSFIDLGLAKKEIEDAGITAFSDYTVIGKFRDDHLSAIGKKRLSSTLRTYKKRKTHKLTTKRLDLDISLESHIALQSLVKESGITRIEIIEKLILQERATQMRKL